ncbi:hypothetical protein R1sor_017167 [Riccia sorocarpa]|uniref:Uncharacterized protein n=1 Tax=Riccia sorocarpa TaxID=122646 RepID=A0ABD3I9M4_9MARC
MRGGLGWEGDFDQSAGICRFGRDGAGTRSSGWTNMEAASSVGREREHDFSGDHAILANKDRLAAGSRNARDNWENDFADRRPTYAELRLMQTVATEYGILHPDDMCGAYNFREEMRNQILCYLRPDQAPLGAIPEYVDILMVVINEDWARHCWDPSA